MKMQRAEGFVLLAMLLLIATMGSAYLVSALNKNYSSSATLREQREALRGLRDAQLALIARALIENNTPGTLPAPSGDQGEENELNGMHDTGYAYKQSQHARRFPWYSLGLPLQTGGSPQCLWYVLSGTHSNLWSTSIRNKDSKDSPAINPSHPGRLQLADGTFAAAILFAPDQPLGFQSNRGAPGTNTCTSGSVSEYLEAGNATNSGPYIITPHPSDPSTLNDIALPITHTQLLRPVLRRILRAVSQPSGMLQILKNGFEAGNSTVAETRIAIPNFDTQLAGAKLETNKELLTPTLTNEQPTCSGISENKLDKDGKPIFVLDKNGEPVLDNDGNPVLEKKSYYTEPVSWLCFNDWYSHMKYLGPKNSIEISLAPSSDYQCRLNLDTAVISCGKLD